MAVQDLRNRIIPTFDSADVEDPYAMFFVVNDAKDEEGNLPPEADIIQASMNALVEMLISNDPADREALNAWMDGRIRKIVKRARGSAWNKVTEQTALRQVTATAGEAQVAVFQPIPVSQQPAELKKLQVTGLQATDSTPLNTDNRGSYLEVVVDETLNMSTGKLVAQVGHAVQLFLMYGNHARVEEWLKGNQLVQVTRTDTMPSVESVDVVVRDAGFTEVPTGSLTAVAVFHLNNQKV